MRELDTNPEIIQNYDLLKRTGVLDHINELNTEINNLEILFKEAWEITSKNSIDDIINYVIKRLLDKYVPSYFTIIIQERTNPKSATILCYKNMQPVETSVDISLEPFKKFFTEYPNPISFSLFEYKLDNSEAAESLRQFSPEILVPIIGFWGLYGLIIIGTKMVDQEYTPKEIAYIDRMMKFTSIGIQNNIHHQSSITDLKTGLYNHSYFIERLEEELARVKRHENQLSLIMIDLDHFKNLNDTYGHMFGDEVLLSVSRIFSKLTRREDIVARFGGEEFVILLTGLSRNTTWYVAERIRKTVEEEPLVHGNKELHVTISLGIRHVSVYSYAPGSKLIEQADKALYTSKNNGRNRSTMFNPGLLFQIENIIQNR